jgi:hypothetical protein
MTMPTIEHEHILLNAHSGEWVPVSETLLEGIQAALYAAKLSDGLVDPPPLGGLERAGYATSRVGIAPAPLAEAPTALEAETLAKIALLRGPHAGRVALERYGGVLILDNGKPILVGGLDAGSESTASERRSA